MLTWTETKLKPLDPGTAPGIRLSAEYKGKHEAHAVWFPGRMWRVFWSLTSRDCGSREEAVAVIEKQAGYKAK